MIFDLAQDVDDAVAAIPRGHPKHRILELLEEAIRRDIHFIDRHPTTLFQCMWNTCWWYDCPEAAKHYAEPEGGWLDPPAWERQGPKLSGILDAWRSGKEKAIPGFCWVRSLCPLVRLGSGTVAVLTGHEECISFVTYSRDGRRIFSGDSGGTIRMWDAGNWRRTGMLVPGQLPAYFREIDLIVVSRDGNRTAAIMGSEQVYEWNLEEMHEIGHARADRADVTSIAYAADGHLAFRMSFRDWRGKPVVGATGDVEAVPRTHIASSDDKHRVVAACRDRRLRVWDERRAEWIHTYKAFDTPIRCVACSPEGDRFAVALMDHSVWIGVEKEGAALKCVHKPIGILTMDPERMGWAWDHEMDHAKRQALNATPAEMLFSADGRYVACRFEGGWVLEWDTEDLSQTAQFIAGLVKFRTLIYGTDDRLYIWATLPNSIKDGRGSTARCWDVATGQEVGRLRGFKDGFASLSFAANGVTLLTKTCRDYGTETRAWDAQTGVEINNADMPIGADKEVANSPDGRLTVLATGKRVTVRPRREDTSSVDGCSGEAVCALRFSPDGKCLATATARGMLHTWVESRCSRMLSVQAHTDRITELRYLPDGRSIVSASDDGSVGLWDACTGALQQRLLGHAKAVNALAISHDGRRIASGSWMDGTVRIWDTDSGQQLLCIEKATPACLAFSPDGLVLACGSFMNGEIQLLDSTAGRALKLLLGHDHRVDSIAFSADGALLVSGNQDTCLFWSWQEGGLPRVIDGEVDVNALVAGRDRVPICAVVHKIETVFEDVDTGIPITWWPRVSALSAAADGVSWAGAYRGRPYCLRLDGCVSALNEVLRNGRGNAPPVDVGYLTADAKTVLGTRGRLVGGVVKAAARHERPVFVARAGDPKNRVSGKKVMDLLCLAIERGGIVTIIVEGRDAHAEAILEELRELWQESNIHAFGQR